MELGVRGHLRQTHFGAAFELCRFWNLSQFASRISIDPLVLQYHWNQYIRHKQILHLGYDRTSSKKYVWGRFWFNLIGIAMLISALLLVDCRWEINYFSLICTTIRGGIWDQSTHACDFDLCFGINQIKGKIVDKKRQRSHPINIPDICHFFYTHTF